MESMPHKEPPQRNALLFHIDSFYVKYPAQPEIVQPAHVGLFLAVEEVSILGEVLGLGAGHGEGQQAGTDGEEGTDGGWFHCVWCLVTGNRLAEYRKFN